jgi:hypothetical protein
MWSSMKQSVDRSESRIRRLGHPKMRLDHPANPKARRLDQGQIPSGKSHEIYRRFQHDSRGCRNGQLSCVLLFSSNVISLKSIFKTDRISMVVTCDFS